MTTIPQRLRDIAQAIEDDNLRAWPETLRAIAAELEAPAADVPHEYSDQWLLARADAAPVVAEYPAGAVENGRAYAARLESSYQFECEAGPLSNCSDWHDLIRCFEHLAAWPTNHLATVAALQARITSLEADLAHAHHAADMNSRDAMARIEALERNQLPAGSLPITEEKLAELIQEGFMAGAKVGAQTLATELLKSGDLKPTAELFKRVM